MTQVPTAAIPKEIRKSGVKELKILWADGHQSVFPFYYLRERCPCAMCVNELTGERMIPAGSISHDVGGAKMELVGHYAITITFTDNHNTGIYKFDNLRAMCPCGQHGE